MLTTKSEKKEIAYYAEDLQKTVLGKYKSANRWFWASFKRYPVLYLIGAITLVGSTYLSTWTTALIGDALDELRLNGFSATFNAIIARMLIFVGLSWIALTIGIYVWAIASFRIQRDMRQEFYEVIQEHSMAFFDVHDSGVILSMGMNEINQIRLGVMPAIRQLLTAVASIAIVTSFLWQVDIIIGATLVVSIVFYFVIAWIYAQRVGPIRRKLAKDLGDLSSISQEMFKGIDTVRSFDNENIEIEKFNLKSVEYGDDMRKEGYLSAFYWPALITIVVTAGAFAYAIYNVIEAVYTIGALITVLALLMSLNRQNFAIPRHLILLQAAFENANRLWDVMSFDDPLEQPLNPLQGDWEQAVSFDKVSFKYPGTDKYVLKNVSFEIPAGARVALIGGPGSGKSTILKLLLRLYDPTEGQININGTSLASMHTQHVRSNVTMVEQDIFLFSDTLRANIAFARTDATVDEIKQAAKRAQISSFIESLPQQYETIIGERGVTLSGGQRQRVAIARALLSDPKLLLLDDSTSAVDIKTELRLRYAMEELMKGRTSIVVTQRLTTLVEADMIILMKRGEVVDIGTHTELMKRCPDYQFMCQYLPMANGLKACDDIDISNGGFNQ